MEPGLPFPNIGLSVERRRGFKEGVIAGIILLIIAAIIYFSKLNQYVPLLMPALVIASVIIFINGARKYKTETWTIFYKKDGEMAAYMEHSMINQSDIGPFEKKFSEMVSLHGSSPKTKNSI